MMFKLQDIVKVVYQPYHHKQSHGDLVGQVGYIEEINADSSRALFQVLTKDGKLGVAAWLPVQCFVIEDNPVWKRAYSLYRDWFTSVTCEAQNRQNTFNKKLTDIANQFSIGVDDVLAITRMVNSTLA